jgi:transposase
MKPSNCSKKYIKKVSETKSDNVNNIFLFSYQGYMTNELAYIFQADRITVYNWFNAWESRQFAGLYDKKGRGWRPILNTDPLYRTKPQDKGYI